MSREKRKAKKEAEKRLSTRQFIGAKEITDYSLVTYGQGELVYFIVKPTNISVLSESSVGARIYALMTVLKGVAEIEMLCLNSRESFEDNKRVLKVRWSRKRIQSYAVFWNRIRPIWTGFRCRWRQPVNF